MKKLFLILLFVVGVTKQTTADVKHNSNLKGQAKIDSLLYAFKTQKEDSNKVMTAIQLSFEYLYELNKTDSAFYYARYAEANLTLVNPKTEWRIMRRLDDLYGYKGRDDLKLEYRLRGLKVAEKNHLIEEKIKSYQLLSWEFNRMGKYEKSLDYYNLGVKEARKNKKRELLLELLNSGINLFVNNKKFDDALIVINEISKLDTSINNNGGHYMTLAYFYIAKQDLIKAEESYFLAIEQLENRKDSGALMMLYHNYAYIPKQQKRYKIAESYYLKSKQMAYTIMPSFVYDCNGNLARLYIEMKEYNSALKIVNEDIPYFEKNKRYDELATRYSTKALILYQLGKYKEAYDFSNQAKSILDSISNNETQNKISQLESNLLEERKNKEIDVITKDKEIQKIIRNSFIGGFLLLFIIALGIFRSLKQNRNAKNIIEKQKAEVERKNTEILDSIEYAKRIQNTILPPQKIVSKYLEQSFILYLPKDIVAGDFYWMNSPKLEKNKNGEAILFAACDCTGHGVPGAMVSVVCSNALNKAVKEFGLTQPAKILDKVAELVIEDLSKNNDVGDEIQDGMDASLCSLNLQTGELQWAGANNSLYVIKSAKGKVQSESNFELETLNFELDEVKADKQPIGKFDNPKPFTNHTIQLQKGDTIYLFTDGYADQFGGPKAKKYSKGKFK